MINFCETKAGEHSNGWGSAGAVEAVARPNAEAEVAAGVDGAAGGAGVEGEAQAEGTTSVERNAAARAAMRLLMGPNGDASSQQVR